MSDSTPNRRDGDDFDLLDDSDLTSSKGSETTNEGAPSCSFDVETLEPRILMSATWVDPDASVDEAETEEANIEDDDAAHEMLDEMESDDFFAEDGASAHESEWMRGEASDEDGEYVATDGARDREEAESETWKETDDTPVMESQASSATETPTLDSEASEATEEPTLHSQALDADADDEATPVMHSQALIEGDPDAPVTGPYATSTPAEELVTNGSFEDNDSPDGSWSVGSNVPGWTLSEGSGIEIQERGAAPAADGSALVELDSHDNSGMYQDLATSDGGQYTLSFEYSPRPGVAESSNGIEVWWNGEQVGSISADGNGLSTTEWTTYTFELEGEGDLTRLEFRAAGTSDSLGGYLDAVSVQAQAQVGFDIPEDLEEGAVLGSVTPPDPEAGPWTFGLGGTGADDFAIDEATGEITVAPGADLTTTGSEAQLTVTVTDAAGQVHEQELTVSIASAANTPDLTVTPAAGAADSAIALDLQAALTDLDGSESLALTISGVPEGATLSAGTDNGDGTWSLTPGEASGLTVTPPAGSSADFTLEVTATSTESDGSVASSSASLEVTVEAPLALDLADAQGTAGTPIPLDIDVARNDDDGAVAPASVIVGGIPEGATLSDGVNVFVAGHGSGAVDVADWDLESLTITTADGDDADFQLSVTASDAEVLDFGGTTIESFGNQDHGGTATVEDGGDTLHLEGNTWKRMEFPYEITPDTVISFDFRADVEGEIHGFGFTNGNHADGSGVQDGEAFRVFGTQNWAHDFETYDGSGDWQRFEIPVGQLMTGEHDYLFFINDQDSGDASGLHSFFRNVQVFESSDESVTGTLDVTVTDGIALDAADSSGDEDTAIPLTIEVSFPEESANEVQRVTLGGVPDGATLSAGTDNGDGTWTLAPADLDGLTITPPEGSDADFDLSVTATTHAGMEVTSPLDGSDGFTQTEVTGLVDQSTGDLEISGTGTDRLGLVTFDSVDVEGDFTMEVDLVTEGDMGYQNGFIIFDYNGPDDFKFAGARDGANYWTIGHYDGDWNDLATLPESITTGDVYNLEVSVAGGVVSLAVDGTERVSHDFGGPVDQGHVGVATDNAHSHFGSLEVSTVADTPSTESETTVHVAVSAVADAPTITIGVTAGLEDTDIPLDLTVALNDLDGSESLEVVIAGVPEGATLSAGVDNGDGSWTLDASDLAGLSLTPPENSDVDFDLSVTATSTEAEGGSAVVNATLHVEVHENLDAPELAVTDASGVEDQPIPLDISLGTTDRDGSETQVVTIAGVPDGATLSAGIDNGDGSWTLTPDELDGLTLMPAEHSDADFQLTVTAEVSTDDTAAPAAPSPDDFATERGTLTPDGDALELTSSGSPARALGLVDLPPLPDSFTLEADVTTAGTMGWQNGFIIFDYNGPNDFKYAGARDGADYWTIGHFDGSFNNVATLPENIVTGDTYHYALEVDGSTVSLSVDGVEKVSHDFGEALNDGAVGVATDNAVTRFEGFTASVGSGPAQITETATLDVHVEADADAPDLTVTDAHGAEDGTIPLDLAAQLQDLDGSETLTITIAGVPEGATLSAGTDNGDGTWTLTADDASGLTITPPADSDADFDLTVTATSEEHGSLASPLDGSDGFALTGVTGTLGVSDDGLLVTGDDSARLGLVSFDDADVDGDFTVSVDMTTRGDMSYQNGFIIFDYNGPDDFKFAGARDGADYWTVGHYDGSWNDLATLPEGIVTGNTYNLELTTAGGVATLSVDGTERVAFDFGETLDDGGIGVATHNANAHFDDLEIESTSHGDTASTTQTLHVTVDPVADAPVVTGQDASGLEDTAIPLELTAALTDLDGSETLSAVTISGVPEGAVLSAGTDNGDGTWSLEAGELAGLTITPPADSDVDFDLTVSATSTEGDGSSETTEVTVSVTVDEVLDAPGLATHDATGLEDQPIALDVSLTSTDRDGSERQVITFSGVPAGATLSAGTDNGDGTWTLTPGDLDGLTVTPAAHSADDFQLTVTVEVSAAGTTEVLSETATIDVTVTADADAVDLVAHDVAGAEDTSIALDLSASLTDVDGSETLSLQISGLPEHVTLSAGTDNGDGTWSLDPADLDGLMLSPMPNADDDYELTITATSTEAEGDTFSTSSTFRVFVDAEADTPTLAVEDVTGQEDTAIALDIDAALTDLDGSETLSVVISGVPDGAVLSAGTDNGDGSWTLAPDQLDGLTVTPPANSDADFQLTVTATSDEANGGTATVSATLDVTVVGVADAPDLQVTDAVGDEDSAIGLDIASSLGDLDGSETLSVVVSGVPDGAVLSAGTDNGDGSWTLAPDQLDGLTVTPPANSDGDFQLTVTATSSEAEGDTSSTTTTLDVTVNAVADAPDLQVTDAVGDEDSAIGLDIASSLGDLDGSETLSIVVSGVPEGAVLSTGTDNGDGSWTLAPDQLDGLTVTPPADSDGDFQLTVTATSSEADGGTATASATLDVTVNAVADAPDLQVTDAQGDEDSAIGLDIATSLGDLDGSETLSIVVSGVPDGAVLSAGTDNGDGSWTLSADQLDGLTVTPPANSDGDFQLTITATSSEAEGDTSSTTATLDVTVNAVADAPDLQVTGAVGDEDSAISLDIASSLGDLDGSETLSVVVSGVPDGAVLSAGTDNGDGSWTLSADQLDGLTVTPPANSDGDFQLTVTATSSEAEGDTSSITVTLDVTVNAVADAPDLQITDAVGDEDTAIGLDIASSLGDLDGSETLSVVVSGVPDGAVLSAGTDNGDGSWTLAPDQLDGLTVTPPANSDEDFQLTVTATSSEADGGTATASATLDVTVNAVADGAALELADASGDEDTPIGLDVSTSLRDLDGSETATVVISGVPDGATLSAGTDLGEGRWELDPAALDGLQFLPPTNFSGDVALTVTVTTTESEGGSTHVTEGDLTVHVTGVADDLELAMTDADGDAGTAIPLDIDARLGDLDGSETLEIRISGLPDGAQLSGGVQLEDGTWVLSAGDLDGLTVTTAGDTWGDFELEVTAIATEADGSRHEESTTSNLTVRANLIGDGTEEPPEDDGEDDPDDEVLVSGSDDVRGVGAADAERLDREERRDDDLTRRLRGGSNGRHDPGLPLGDFTDPRVGGDDVPLVEAPLLDPLHGPTVAEGATDDRAPGVVDIAELDLARDSAIEDDDTSETREQRGFFSSLWALFRVLGRDQDKLKKDEADDDAKKRR